MEASVSESGPMIWQNKVHDDGEKKKMRFTDRVWKRESHSGSADKEKVKNE
jgi:hypothetical protein